MAAAGRAGEPPADWYSQFDAQYEALLHLRDRQPPSTQPTAANHGEVAGRAAPTATADIEHAPSQPRPQSSQSSQRRATNGVSRRTNSDFPHSHKQPSAEPSCTPASAGGHSAASGVPAEFHAMMQQQVDSKQRAAHYKKQRALEKVERMADEAARRAEHRAKMKAIQLRAPATPTLSAAPSPIDTPHASRPVSRRRGRLSYEADELAEVETRPASLQSASIAPMVSLVPTAPKQHKQLSHTRRHSSNQTSPPPPPPPRTPTKQPTPATHPTSAHSIDCSPSTATAHSTDSAHSRDSLRSLMRASRRQLQQQQGGEEAVVEVRVGGPYTPRTGSGSTSAGMVRHASCEFDVVFASATVSLACSPAETRRTSLDDVIAVERPH